MAQMVIVDITLTGEPSIQDMFYAVLSPNSFCGLAHLAYPTEGSKDAKEKPSIAWPAAYSLALLRQKQKPARCPRR